MSPSFFFVCPTIHRRWQNPTQNFQEVVGTENACPRSVGGGQAFVTGDYEEQDFYNFWIEYIILQMKYKL